MSKSSNLTLLLKCTQNAAYRSFGRGFIFISPLYTIQPMNNNHMACTLVFIFGWWKQRPQTNCIFCHYFEYKFALITQKRSTQRNVTYCPRSLSACLDSSRNTTDVRTLTFLFCYIVFFPSSMEINRMEYPYSARRQINWFTIKWETTRYQRFIRMDTSNCSDLVYGNEHLLSKTKPK